MAAEGEHVEITGAEQIDDCGQNGIVGHMGCVFSEVYGNEIYNIAQKGEWYGYEVAAIKFHVAIDVQIHDNYIHDSSRGSWMDWQAQGTHIYRNIYENNLEDIMVEVSHGPCLIENNILTSKCSTQSSSSLVINKDLLQNPIGAHPVPGPLQSLKEGENLIRISWYLFDETKLLIFCIHASTPTPLTAPKSHVPYRSFYNTTPHPELIHR